MMLRKRIAVVGGVAVLGVVLTGCDLPQPWQNELVSSNAAGTGSGNGESFVAARTPAFSPDGTRIAFSSRATNLGPPDHNGAYDVYVRDLRTGTVELVSTNAAGTDGGNGDSSFPVFSPDGDRIAFFSRADDLGPLDSPRLDDDLDVYVRDLRSGTTSLVSTNAGGTDSGDATSGFMLPVFSPDGTKLAFESLASDLGTITDANFSWDVFVRDLTTDTTTLVSANQAGTGTNEGDSHGPVFSPDGTKVAFYSAASGLQPIGTFGLSNVYLRDLTTSTTTLVSVNAAGTLGANDRSFLPTFSPNGHEIAFTSDATDMGPTDTNRFTDVYLRDLTAGTTELVSANGDGTDAGDAGSSSEQVGFSPDGTKIAFVSAAGNLGPTDANGTTDVYLRDLSTAHTTLVSADTAGVAGNGSSALPGFSPDGTRIVFVSTSSDLGFDNADGFDDVYVRDLQAATTQIVSTDPGGAVSGDRDSTEPFFSPDGTRIAYRSAASNLVANDTNGDTLDVFLATLESADLAVESSATPDPAPSGGRLTFHIDVTNDGPTAAEAATAALLVPDGATFADAASTSGTCAAPAPSNPRLVSCDLGEIAAGSTVAVDVDIDVTAPTGSTLTALAAARATTVDPTPGNDVASVAVTVG
jgi:Tol biopolymer transport system component